MLGPITILLLACTSLLEESSFLRPALCSVLVTLRYIISNVFHNTFFFSFVFRCLLVLYADRGLVSRGRLHLVLFHRLFWITVVTWCALLFGLMPVAPLLKDWASFPRCRSAGQAKRNTAHLEKCFQIPR